jgi:hypothetical protein
MVLSGMIFFRHRIDGFGLQLFIQVKNFSPAGLRGRLKKKWPERPDSNPMVPSGVFLFCNRSFQASLKRGATNKWS